jgi:hypothetical protein
MYSQRELTRLAAHKVTLRRDIALRRAQCAEAAAALARPFALLDRVVGLARRVAPFVAVPLGLMVARRVFPRLKVVGSFVLGAMRGLGAIFNAPAATKISRGRG